MSIRVHITYNIPSSITEAQLPLVVYFIEPDLHPLRQFVRPICAGVIPLVPIIIGVVAVAEAVAPKQAVYESKKECIDVGVHYVVFHDVLLVLCNCRVAHCPRQLRFALRSVAVAVQQTIPHVSYSWPVVCRR